jgi:iron-sulfur cluster assembly accessory protein
MKSTTETEQSEVDLDKFFSDLEAQLDESEVARLAQAVMKRQTNDRNNLDQKILSDFHGHAPTIDNTFTGKLPTLSPKAQIFITENLEEGQYFRLGIEGGGCSGFNYLLDIANYQEEHDILFSESPPALVDDMSVKYLYGSEVDLYTEGMNKMLKVTNPGAKASCGCGTSFAFDEDLLDMY